MEGCGQPARLEVHFDCEAVYVQRPLGQEKSPVCSRFFRCHMSCSRATTPKCGTWTSKGQARPELLLLAALIGPCTGQRLLQGTKYICAVPLNTSTTRSLGVF